MEILEYLEKHGQIEFKGKERDGFFVYIMSPKEVADRILEWARTWGKNGKIETVRWLAMGEETEGESKHFKYFFVIWLHNDRISC